MEVNKACPLASLRVRFAPQNCPIGYAICTISRYSEEGIKILYHLIKTRDDLGNATVFTCQYDPIEWGKQISDDPGCYGKLDGIRRRLTTGYTILIEKV